MSAGAAKASTAIIFTGGINHPFDDTAPVLGLLADVADDRLGEPAPLGDAQALTLGLDAGPGDDVQGHVEDDQRALTLRRHDLLTHGLLAASARPLLRRRLVPAAHAAPWLFRFVVNEVARPVDGDGVKVMA